MEKSSIVVFVFGGESLEIEQHRFLGLPVAKPRVWLDLSSFASKRAGLAMHSPGRKVLRIAVRVLGWFAWLPIEKIIRGPIKRFNDLDGYEVIRKAVGEPIEYLTLYMGNDSAKTKLTLLVRVNRSSKSKLIRDVIVKLGRTPEAAEAIKNEAAILKRIENTELAGQIPAVVGDIGHDGIWTWSEQTILPRGKSPVRLQKEHRKFLEDLRRVGVSHGDFAPWNCSIHDGKLYVWDWEDAGPWRAGKDETWFKSQVKNLLGIDA